MKLLDLDTDSLKERIGEWLASPESAEAPLGLKKAEAFRRAEQLKLLIVAGVVSPFEVELDEDFKDVLYALASLVSSSLRGERSAREAWAVSRFIRGISWPDDAFGEKADLAGQCAVAAQEAADAATVARGRGRSVATDSEQDVRKIFDESADLVRAVLVRYHGLAEAEAQELEQDLLTWLRRFRERPFVAPIDMRTVLLAVCSQLAREYRRFQATRPSPSAQVRLRDLLGWPPPANGQWNRGPSE
jgi:hypothetical protein